MALISAIGASFFLQDALRFFESLWRNTFYLTYPTLDILDTDRAAGAQCGGAGEIVTGDFHRVVDLGGAPSLRQPN